VTHWTNFSRERTIFGDNYRIGHFADQADEICLAVNMAEGPFTERDRVTMMMSKQEARQLATQLLNFINYLEGEPMGRKTATDYRCIHCGSRDTKATPTGWICRNCRKPWESAPVTVAGVNA
jgi:hypothetical protein